MLRIAGTPLQQLSWDNLLRSESMTRDVFQDFEGTFQDDKKSIPNGILAKVKLAASANYHTIGLLKNLSGSGTVGREEQLGREVDQELKELKVYSNDVSHAVNTERYGIDAHDKEAYKILSKVQPQLSRWHKEINGKYIRESHLERYSSNLLVAPTSLTKRWNENCLVKNVSLASQPAYDSTNSTYETNISNALVAGGAGTSWDVHFLSVLEHWATAVKKIEPLDNGRYIVTVPSAQAIGLRDVSDTGSIAHWYRDSTIAMAAKNAYAQYLGSYGCLDLYEDARAAVIGDVGPGNITAYYKGAGDDDDRASAAGTLYDVGGVWGKGAIFMASHEELHFEEEVQNYRKVIGVGAFAGYGCTRTVFDDVGSETDTSEINQNSAIILTAKASVTA